MPEIQNNSAHYQDLLSKSNRESSGGKHGAAAGFEYAVQPDGTCYADRQWEELRQIKGFSFVSAQDPTVEQDSRLYQTLSIARLETSHQALRRSYQERQKPPELDVEAPIRPPETAPTSLATLSTIQEPQHATDAPFLSPSRRIRNRHNAVYGQHLPNAMNSPACAAKVFGETSTQKEERARCQNFLSGNGNTAGATNETWRAPTASATNNSILETDDVDDSLFMEVDVDQLVAQRENSRQTQSLETTFDYGNDWDNSSRRASRGNNAPPASSRYSNGTVSTVSNETPSNGSHYNSFRSGDRDSYGTFNGSYNDTSFGGGNSNCLEVSRRSSSFSGVDNRESYSSHATAQDGTFATMPESQGAFTTANNFNTNSSSSYNDSFADDNYGSGSAHGSFSMMNTSNASGAPLCPGHNQPCCLLTANTAANSGRQFYKCSMPGDEKCDFFEWADGIEGNLNPPEDTQYGGGGGGGTGVTMDIFQENRRIFGHHSFRPGQQVVIENAVRGNDVFVLMPTGGGKSLCYQLPACCCPGLSVIISPLLSLIQDQVQSLKKLGVNAVFLNSAQDFETEQRQILQDLNNTSDHGGVKLLYITPEKLSHSGIIKNILQRLYGKNLISRFVIDEAHCLSDWGKFAHS